VAPGRPRQTRRVGSEETVWNVSMTGYDAGARRNRQFSRPQGELGRILGARSCWEQGEKGDSRDAFRATGLDVSDLGDLAAVRFRPDPGQPRQQNLPLVVDVARQVAEKVDHAGDDRVPLVLGGDCSLSLGVITGLLRHHTRLGLVYFDADLDLNTPETTPSGTFDGMVQSHVLGNGIPELAGLGLRQPMVAEPNIVLFGYDVDTGRIDPYEIEVLGRSSMWKYPLPEIRDNPTTAARSALREIEGGWTRCSSTSTSM